MLYDKSRLMLALGFSFTLPHLTIITHILYHNTTWTNSHLSHLLILKTHITLQFDCRNDAKYKMVHTLTAILSKVEPKGRMCKGLTLVHNRTNIQLNICMQNFLNSHKSFKIIILLNAVVIC